MKIVTLFLALVLLPALQLAAQTRIFPFGSPWKYLEGGTDPGTAWRFPGFDDSSWKAGNGLFGYGNNNETTLISFGPDPDNKFITTWFRKTIAIPNPLIYTSFTGHIKRDDGVVVYVNGTEVFRNNMPVGTIDFQTRASSAPDNGNTVLPFTINASAFVSGNNVIAVEVHQTNNFSFDMAFDLELQGTLRPQSSDQTPPTVLSFNRQMPATEITNSTSVIFRLTFSEAVTGVDLSDIRLVSTASGTLAGLEAVGTGGTTYDVTVNGISGSGTLGLMLKDSDTGIVDASNNLLSGGITGQTYTIVHDTKAYGFTAVTSLEPIASRIHASKGKEQAKVFRHAGRHWAVIASTGGTYLWRLDNTAWTNILRVSQKNARADCIVDGNVTHIFLFQGESSELVSVEYNPDTETYQPWRARETKVDLVLDDGVETGMLARDGTGRLWLASDAITDIRVRYSDAPYTQWSNPITIASGIDSDDICAIIAMPRTRQIGVLWSNQKTRRFGFRTHTDGQPPATWSTDEKPASQSALNEGKGMADDHLNMKISSDGTLYCAVKTGYDEPGYPRMALLIRRPNGTWDDLYGISETGTAPMVLLNETAGRLRVVYASQTYGGEIHYKESRLSRIAFGQDLTLISGVYDYATSSHQNFSFEVVILASDEEHTVGVLARDGLAPVPEPNDSVVVEPIAPGLENEIKAFPNPFGPKTTIRFIPRADGPYTMTLFDRLGQIISTTQGLAQAGKEHTVEIVGAGLTSGLYYAQLQTNDSTKVFRLLRIR